MVLSVDCSLVVLPVTMTASLRRTPVMYSLGDLASTRGDTLEV
jgi:hypothetical protein